MLPKREGNAFFDLAEWMVRQVTQAEENLAKFTPAEMTTALAVIAAIGKIQWAKMGPQAAGPWVKVLEDLRNRVASRKS